MISSSTFYKRCCTIAWQESRNHREKVHACPSIVGPKNAKVYNADSLMRTVYLGAVLLHLKLMQAVDELG